MNILKRIWDSTFKIFAWVILAILFWFAGKPAVEWAGDRLFKEKLFLKAPHAVALGQELKYLGLPVGKILSADVVSPDEIVMIAYVKPRAHIARDSKFLIKQGLFGKVIEIVPGSDSLSFTGGDTIQVVTPMEDVKESTVSTISKVLKELSEALKRDSTEGDDNE